MSAKPEDVATTGAGEEKVDAETRYQIDQIRARRMNNFHGTAEEWIAFEYGSATVTEGEADLVDATITKTAPPPAPWQLRLYDRADGVKGHYCVGRFNPAGYHEFWNKDQFCSAGEVFTRRAAALAKVGELSSAPTPVQPPDAPQDERDPRDDGSKCQRCGTRYKVDVMVSDELWTKIHGDDNLLCGPCIVNSIETISDFDRYNLTQGDGPSTSTTGEAARKIETRLGMLPLSLIDDINGRRESIYRGWEYQVDPKIASQMKTDLDYLRAFVAALLPHHFPPTEATQVAVEAAAQEIEGLIYLPGSKDSYRKEIAAIISKHLPDAGEVERLRRELKREQKDHQLTVDVFCRQELIWQQQTAEEVATARADAIRDAIAEVHEAHAE